MTVILDLDHTLLDTSHLKQAMEDHAAKAGVPRDVFQKTYTETVTGEQGTYNYELARHAAFMHRDSGVDESIILAELHAALDTLPTLLFEDSIPFLKKLRERGDKIALLTFGNPKFQEEKVLRLNISEYFDTFIFSEHEKSSAAFNFEDGPESWVFINDNPNEIRALREKFPTSRMIRIKRQGGKPFPEDQDALDVETVASLSDIHL